MTGTEIVAVVGAIVAFVLSVGSGVRSYKRARDTMKVSRGLDAAAALLEDER